MKNKVKFKKYLFNSLFLSLIFCVLFLIINIYEYRVYTINFNNKINSIVSEIIDKYPDVSEEEIISILNNSSTNKNVLSKYSISLEKDSIVLENKKKFNLFLCLNVLFLFISLLIIIFLNFLYRKIIDKDISNITRLIENINKKNYDLEIDSISEDELSILKNEIYKTTIILKEAADNSLKDNVNLKKSLEDISHQLKTPLTSILIMLDNLIEDREMDSLKRDEFILDIKRNVNNINFLVQSILKLSKFDSNTISFIRKDVLIKKIIDTSISNVSTLCDLKDVKISVLGDLDFKVMCDYNWQVEAITNVLKNSIDHSKSGDVVEIKCSDNSVYSCIEISDMGDGISKKDIKHIFERFYKGENASSDSIGIGLSLSKSIIEEDNGNISCESSNNGTKFTIKYLKI